MTRKRWRSATFQSDLGLRSRAAALCYRDAIGGEWADYLQTLYRKGKGEWLYAIPALASEQQLLYDLCRQTLAFENHYF